MTAKLLAPNEVLEIGGNLTLRIQNLDPYKYLSWSKENVSGLWYQVDARNFILERPPIFVKNPHKETLQIVY